VLRIVTFIPGKDHPHARGMHELPVTPFAALDAEARFFQVGDQLANLARLRNLVPLF